MRAQGHAISYEGVLRVLLADLAQPGFHCHPLRGRVRRYAIHVNGPWRITFEWQDGRALRVDLEQYH